MSKPLFLPRIAGGVAIAFGVPTVFTVWPPHAHSRPETAKVSGAGSGAKVFDAW